MGENFRNLHTEKSRLFFLKTLLFFAKSQDFLPLSLRIFLYEWKSWLCCPNKMLICNQNGDRSPKVSFFLQSISWTWLTKSQYHNPAKEKKNFFSWNCNTFCNCVLIRKKLQNYFVGYLITSKLDFNIAVTAICHVIKNCKQTAESCKQIHKTMILLKENK